MSTDEQSYLNELNRRTLKKLDTVLLPFLALLFLFNSLDRSNVSINSFSRYCRVLEVMANFLKSGAIVRYRMYLALRSRYLDTL
jgi:hypothetical protein